MATRLYLPSSGTAASSPAVASAWERSASVFFRAPTFTAKRDTALADSSDTFGSTSTSQTAVAQWVSPPLDVDQTISGTASIVVRGSENAGTANLYLAFGLRVMVGDTSTERGVLLFNGTETGGTEYGTGTRTRIWSAVSLSSVNALAGDRLVVEIGWHGLLPDAGAAGVLRFGDPVAVADHALTSNVPTDLVPWVELSQTVTFSSALVAIGAGVSDCLAVGLASTPGPLECLGAGVADCLAAPGGLGALEAVAAGVADGSATASAAGSLVAFGDGVADLALVPAATGALVGLADGLGNGELSGFPFSAQGGLLPIGAGVSDCLAAPAAAGSLAAIGAGVADCLAVGLATTPGPLECLGDGVADALAQALAATAGDLAAIGAGVSDGLAVPAAAGALVGLCDGISGGGYFPLIGRRIAHSRARRASSSGTVQNFLASSSAKRASHTSTQAELRFPAARSRRSLTIAQP